MVPVGGRGGGIPGTAGAAGVVGAGRGTVGGGLTGMPGIVGGGTSPPLKALTAPDALDATDEAAFPIPPPITAPAALSAVPLNASAADGAFSVFPLNSLTALATLSADSHAAAVTAVAATVAANTPIGPSIAPAPAAVPMLDNKADAPRPPATAGKIS